MTMLLNDFLDTSIPDPNFANVALLLHGDGTPGSQVFTDDSSFHHTVSVAGDTQIGSSQVKFGQSMVFDGNGDYLFLDSSDLGPIGTQDAFTFEGWVYPTLEDANRYVFSLGTGSNQRGLLQTSSAHSGGGKLVYQDTVRTTTVGNLPANQWAHVVLGRTASGQMTVHLNGTEVMLVTFVGSISSKLTIGANTDQRAADTNQKFIGYMDDIRYTKLVSRYGTGNFTPPAAPYPNH